MKHTITNIDYTELSELIAARIGIHYPRERWKDMERGISAAAMEFGFTDAQSCVDKLLTSSLTRTQLEILASHLTIGETYFFREPKSFEFIEQQVLNPLIQSRSGKDQTIRIWSAGCATGEEPYTLAIIINRLLPDVSNWNISILATDINPRFLQKASDGIYNEWSFRGVPQWIKDGCFTTTANGRYRLHKRIKQMVTFSYLNLAEDTYPALTNGTNAMDLILCRNVLMYFSVSHVKRVIESLHRCLKEDGWLGVSSVEASHDLFSAFKPVNQNGVTFYRKNDVIHDKNSFTIDIQQKIIAQDFSFLPEFKTEIVPDLPDLLSEDDENLVENKIIEHKHESVSSVTRDPDNLQIATELYQQGNYQEAAEKLELLLTESRQNIQAMQLMARILANQGRFTEAIQWCEKAVNNEKLNAANYYLLATIQQECGKSDEAITTLNRALYLEPDFVLANFTLGNLVRAKGKTKEANRHLSNTLKLLNKYNSEDILPESEGLTAKRLKEILESVSIEQEAA